MQPSSGSTQYAEGSPPPFAHHFTPQQHAACNEVLQAWLVPENYALWRTLAAMVDPETTQLNHEQRAYLVYLCYHAHAQTAFDKRSIEHFNSAWPEVDQRQVLTDLTALDTIADMCSYMRTLRVRHVGVPPFGAGAEQVLRAISKKWPHLTMAVTTG